MFGLSYTLNLPKPYLSIPAWHCQGKLCRRKQKLSSLKHVEPERGQEPVWRHFTAAEIRGRHLHLLWNEETPLSFQTWIDITKLSRIKWQWQSWVDTSITFQKMNKGRFEHFKHFIELFNSKELKTKLPCDCLPSFLWWEKRGEGTGWDFADSLRI